MMRHLRAHVLPSSEDDDLMSTIAKRGLRGDNVGLSRIARVVGALMLYSGLAYAQPSGWTKVTVDLVEALRNGGIPAAAALVGNYVDGQEDDAESIAEDLLHLAEFSQVIVRGKVIAKSQARLSPSLKSITTDYTIEVLEWFHGPLVNGQQVAVTMPGGLVQFSNGTTAEWRPVRNRFFAINDEYVLYLTQISVGNSTFYVPTLGPQGVFGFGADGKVRSHARQIDTVYQKYANMERLSFLNAVRASAVH
jgi:hypothetical protein